MDKDYHYIKAFQFYKDIINDLSEKSEIILMFLQLNSGSFKDITKLFYLLNNKTCYKISMISINEIKEHLYIIFQDIFIVIIRKMEMILQ